MEVLNNLEKILIIQTAFIGDAILTLPMIEQLHKNFVDLLIDVIAIPATAEIFNASPFVNNVIVIEKHGKHKSLLPFLKFCLFIKKANYTLIYSPHRSFRTALIVRFSGVKKTYGFNTASLSFVYKNKIKYISHHHEVQRNLDLIGYDCNNNNWKIKPQITFQKSVKNKVEKFLDKFRHNKFIAVAPGSVWFTKKYPKENYIKIIEYLVQKGFYIFLIGGSFDKNLCSEIEKNFENNVINAAGKFSIIESIYLINSCRLLISNDSAPTHMAMATNTPVLVLFTSTVAEFGFYPYLNDSKFIGYNNLKCKPCGIHGRQFCKIKSFDCAYNLTVTMVINEIEKILMSVDIA